MKIKEKHKKLWKQYLSYSLYSNLTEVDDLFAIECFFIRESTGVTLPVEKTYRYGDPVSQSEYLYLAAINGKMWLGWHIQEWANDIKDGLLTLSELEFWFSEESYRLTERDILAIKQAIAQG